MEEISAARTLMSLMSSDDEEIIDERVTFWRSPLRMPKKRTDRAKVFDAVGHVEHVERLLHTRIKI